ncbi:MAG: zinc ribbon domain-containing protein [Phycisphaerales bacterium]|nr:zinc ribbon domain-containing protein [Phycisphaerales bacterium]
MSRARKWIRIGRNVLLLITVCVAGWLLAQPFVETKPNSQWSATRFTALIDGTLYVAELREEVSQAPWHLVRDVSVKAAPVKDLANPSRSIPNAAWPLHLELERNSNRVRIVETLSEKVIVDDAEVAWFGFRGPDVASEAPPVSWLGNRLALWPPGSLGVPFWRQSVNHPARLGRQYELSIYWPYAYKVIGAALGAALVILIACWLIDRLLAPYVAGACQKCGYDLRGSTSNQCPECGAPVGAASSTSVPTAE